METRKSLEAGNAPQMPIVYKKADLVIKHHLYTKTWFLPSAIPLTVIYLLIKFHFNLFSTWQDMARIGIHYEKWLWGENSINI